MAPSLATGHVSWKSFFMVQLFPAHLLLGLAAVPTLLYYLLQGSWTAWALLVAYLPFYLQPAHRRLPGWKSARLFRLFGCKRSFTEYSGQFGVHVSERIDPGQQYFVAVHPHGPLCFGRMFWHSEDLLALFGRDWRMLAASVLFSIPIIRDMSLLFGAVDAGRPTVERILKAGFNAVLYPGALDETNSVGRPDEVSLRTRTGFIRIAVQHGTSVLPMFCFGELDIVTPVQVLPASAASFLQRTLRVSSTVFLGRWGLPLPTRTPLNMVVGRPVATRKCEVGAELDAEVERVHAAYKDELRRMFEDNKERFGYSDRKLLFRCEQDAGNQKKRQ
mmetsp:Transcript_29629/g.80067  ORF Transcript_29629/g.80067 Transcript_29629/m.80067 type:complete len:332 (-) Transcript_29629:109-1104(-)